MMAIHPYVGITRIRLEGIISARNMQAPLEYREQRYKELGKRQKEWPFFLTHECLLGLD